MDFLLYDQLESDEIASARDFIERVKLLGEAERLTQRKLGFGR